MNKSNNIILIGIMGTGKTYIGKSIANQINLTFIDTDTMIETQEKATISTLFKTKGEPYFRNCEASICKILIQLKNHVISTGGGIVLQKENIQNLKKAGTVFLLDSTVDEILERTKTDTSRPLLNRPDKKDALIQLLNNRQALYQEAADIVIRSDNRSIETIAKEIIDQYKNITQ